MKANALLAIVVLSASVSWSAVACPQGYMPAGDSQNPRCVPAPQGNVQRPTARPITMWSPRYAAVSYNPVADKWGASEQQVSEQRARDLAVEACEEQSAGVGIGECEVDAFVSNGCLTVAVGRGTFGYGAVARDWRTSRHKERIEQQAKKEAVKRCEKGGEKCKIIYANCSFAEIVPISN